MYTIIAKELGKVPEMEKTWEGKESELMEGQFYGWIVWSVYTIIMKELGKVRGMEKTWERKGSELKE